MRLQERLWCHLSCLLYFDVCLLKVTVTGTRCFFVSSSQDRFQGKICVYTFPSGRSCCLLQTTRSRTRDRTVCRYLVKIWIYSQDWRKKQKNVQLEKINMKHLHSREIVVESRCCFLVSRYICISCQTRADCKSHFNVNCSRALWTRNFNSLWPLWSSFQVATLNLFYQDVLLNVRLWQSYIEKKDAFFITLSFSDHSSTAR